MASRAIRCQSDPLTPIRKADYVSTLRIVVRHANNRLGFNLEYPTIG
jgi:hypothetical protein